MPVRLQRLWGTGAPSFVCFCCISSRTSSSQSRPVCWLFPRVLGFRHCQYFFSFLPFYTRTSPAQPLPVRWVFPSSQCWDNAFRFLCSRFSLFWYLSHCHLSALIFYLLIHEAVKQIMSVFVMFTALIKFFGGERSEWMM